MKPALNTQNPAASTPNQSKSRAAKAIEAHPVRTRFAPSPTGFIHLGNIRSALYPWAFARNQAGTFVLRIEDSDLERSSPEAVRVILESMAWLGLDCDAGPIYQTQRMPRYQAVLEQLQAQGLVYPCYMRLGELDDLRERQLARKEKPRYDGTWRPEPGKVLPSIPVGAQPVLRFKNPQTGSVAWEDKVKGRIEVNNSELDDLVIARADGTPTYNFCVVVDDMDMQITHVIRGDDHVNNTPRQINIFNALDYPVPIYAHLPTVLNAAGEKMSKRNGAKAAIQYREEGYLPGAIINYLARLGWSHGNDEIFSQIQLLEWFDLTHLGKNAAQFDEAKLRWVNAQHIKNSADIDLARQLQSLWDQRGMQQKIELGSDSNFSPDFAALCALFKDRCDTLVQLLNWAEHLYCDTASSAADQAQYLTPAIAPALVRLSALLGQCEWSKTDIAAALKATLAEFGLKMPQLAMPVRVAVLGLTQSPSLDAVLCLIPREAVVVRLQSTQLFQR